MHLLAAGLLALPLFIGSGDGAQAQSAFCPTSVAQSPSTLAQTGGTCTNRATPGVDPSKSTGAFSGAALASQALSDLAQSATQETTQTAADAINKRRTEEQERCADGFTRVNGVCERVRPAPAVAAPAASPRPVASPRRAARTVSRPVVPSERRMIVKGPELAPVPVFLGPRYGVWGQVFGDWERRNASGSTNIVCCTNAGGINNTVLIDVRSRTSTGGFMAGADLTSRGLWAPGDGLTTGLLVGYVDSTVKVTTTTTSTTANVASGTSAFSAHLSGPSLGIYTNYFLGAFSADLLFKVDMLSVDESFNDVLGFSANTALNPFTSAFSGRASTNLLASTLKGNINYRFALTQTAFFEPTAGFQWTSLSYDSNAAALGLDDGHAFRLQGGARIGTVFEVSPGTRLTASLTGLAYSNVAISGGFIQGGAFGTSDLLSKADEGKLRGEGILNLALEQSNGWSGFVQGSLRGGSGLSGGGAKAGIRYQW
jgi:hypothetical protein